MIKTALAEKDFQSVILFALAQFRLKPSGILFFYRNSAKAGIRLITITSNRSWRQFIFFIGKPCLEIKLTARQFDCFGGRDSRRVFADGHWRADF